MPPQPRGCLVDPAEVRRNAFARPAPRYYEVGIVGARAPEVVDHEVAPVRLDGGLEPFYGREQVRECVRILGARQGDPTLFQPGRNLRRGGRPLFVSMWIETALELFVVVHSRSSSLQRPPQRDAERSRVPRLLMETAIDEEPRRAAHTAPHAAQEIFTHPLRVHVGGQLAPNPVR